MPTFMWSIGLVNTLTQFLYPPPYSFNTVTVATFYFAPTVACVLGDFWGRWFNDFLANRYIRIHDGSWKPEIRLWATWPATVIGICALVLTGQTLQHHLHWIGLAFGWASSVLNFWRTTGGLTVVYFQIQWIEAIGFAATFGCQAAICAVAFIFTVVTQFYGKSWRNRFPPPIAEN
ncbi:uncharacterized protein Z518_00270 [Rhinocladiella mackenziei CBS 650.93]|uniref:Uncharacterized protein n=1 Tax=Rhinocladiella mackenziei CBS 650.93 TaxID=1442369 RepID=A0A0D2J0J5_9EURO|nr:uncharacterized protein Z518_00270 [Rhinocladiella mackenziei CBS 650.93]KIX09191.1 hypothetical protein Z518_00270 [Rhinocladiella mackenziei CBS 650.93]